MRSRAKVGSNFKKRLEKLAKNLGYDLIYEGKIPYFIKDDEKIPYVIINNDGEIIDKYIVVSKAMFEKLKRFYDLAKKGDPFKFAKPVIYYGTVKGIRFKGENKRY